MLDRYGDEQPGHFNVFAVADCGLCDDHGYRGNRVCDHVDHVAAAKRGMDTIRALMGWDQ